MLKITAGVMHVCVCMCVLIIIHRWSITIFSQIFYTYDTPTSSSIFCTYKMQLFTRLTNTPLGLAANYISYTAAQPLHEILIHNRTYRILWYECNALFCQFTCNTFCEGTTAKLLMSCYFHVSSRDQSV